MAVNRNKPDKWKTDIAQSVDMYNDWFIRFAPEAYRNVRAQTTRNVEAALKTMANRTDIGVELLRATPGIWPILRMAACPPLAVDRLIRLAGVPAHLVKVMEKDERLPPRMSRQKADSALGKIASVIQKMADKDILVWLEQGAAPSEQERYRAATVVADRLCGAMANPIIRNAQEERQLAAIAAWLEEQGYIRLVARGQRNYVNMEPGSFSLRMNVPVAQKGTGRQVNVSVDAVILSKAAKMVRLRQSYGEDAQYILFLCGYFDSGYLGYEAAEGIDWIWEHRIEDLGELGL